MNARPEPSWPAPEGHEHIAVVSPRWRLVTGKKCRRMFTGHRYCGNPSVAEFDRSSRAVRKNFWAYCADHMYGNWIENGQVMHWVVRRKEGGNASATP